MRFTGAIAAVGYALIVGSCGSGGGGRIRPYDMPPKDVRAPYDAWDATVVRVVDGDTVVLRFGGRAMRARLIGVDAPEIWSRRECHGAEATLALRRLVPPGSSVRVAGDVEAYDRYRRRLVYLWTPRGRFVQAELVRGGYARVLTVPPDTRFAGVLRAAEAEARRSRTGLWRACRLPGGRMWPGSGVTHTAGMDAGTGPV